MLTLKPHTVTVAPAIQSTAAETETEGAPDYGAVVATVACMFDPISVEGAFRMFGVETIKPATLFVEVADAEAFTMGARIIWTARGKAYVVKGEAVYRDALPETAHAVILLEEMTYKDSLDGL